MLSKQCDGTFDFLFTFSFFLLQTSDTGDTKELQRRLDQALKEVEEYKSKYEQMKKVC